jgi:hypothetical protein
MKTNLHWMLSTKRWCVETCRVLWVMLCEGIVDKRHDTHDSTAQRVTLTHVPGHGKTPSARVGVG